MLSAQTILRQATSCWAIQVRTRTKSSKYLKTRPRSFRRRLYEAAVTPVLPETRTTPAERCIMRPAYQEALKAEREEMPPIEKALAQMVKDFMRSYRVMALCQMNSIDSRSFWLARNQLRLQGLEARYYKNRMMKHIFEGTPLQTLEPLLTSANCYLFAKELDSIKQIMSCTQKYNWITPLGSVKVVQKLAQLSSVSMLPAQTVALLSNIPRRTTQVLDHYAQQLVSSLDQIAKSKKTDE